MEAFLVRAILPKLAYCIQMELQINPHKQVIGEEQLSPNVIQCICMDLST